MKIILCIMILFLMLPLAAQQELPSDLPTAIPAIPIKKPTEPLPPPVQPSFVPPAAKTPAVAATPVPTPAKPSTPTLVAPEDVNDFPAMVQGAATKAADKAADIIANPNKIGDAIVQAPQTLPKALEGVQQTISNLRQQDPNVFNGTNFDKLNWRNSMMFPPEKLQVLYNVAKGLTDQSVGAVFVEVKVPRVAPAFFLNSVLYNTADNWTIWLNSRRIRADATFPELEITKVYRDSVEFIWETDQLDFISPDWEKVVPAIELQEGEEVPRFTYISKDGLVAVDRSRRFVRFTLGPQQTFVSRKMEIREGFVKSSFFETVERVAVPAAGAGSNVISIQNPPAISGLPAAAGAPQATIPVPSIPQAPPPAAAGINPLNPLAPPSAILQTR